jgi:hypothetical protein
MSKKRKKSAPAKARWRFGGGKRRRYLVVGSVGLIAILGLATVAGSWRPLSRTRVGSLFFSSPPPPVPPPSSPSKEYIYAGGRLVATEEPNPLSAPLNLIAATFSQAQINISWNAVANAHHYQVERASVIGESNFAAINTNVAGTSLSDTTVTSGVAYLYRVKAADAAGNVSPASNIDVATAITFEDDPFPAPPTYTPIRAQHIVQLRAAINAVRVAVGKPQATWTQTINPAQPGTVTIMAIDVEELRTKLDEALLVLNLPTGGYTNSSLTGVQIMRDHIRELRDRVK